MRDFIGIMENKNLKEPKNSALNIPDIISRFGECRYSCQLTHEPSWFHTIKFKDLCLYIEEWMDIEDAEICATIFKTKKKNGNGFVNTNLYLLLDDVEWFIKNDL